MPPVTKSAAADCMSNAKKLVGAALVAACAVMLAPVPAMAQFSDGYEFLQAVRKSDGTKVTQLLSDPASTLVNTRDVTSGETGLHITVARADPTWTGFLLERGANPNVADKSGVTPLQTAVSINFIEGAKALLENGANPNTTNSVGETPLITAVLSNRMEMAKLLLKHRADPDRADRSGRSARDYAVISDNRRMLDAIEAADDNGGGQQYGPAIP